MFSTNKASGRAAAAIDPNFPNVSLLLHGDGTNGAQNNTFIDSSTNNFTITRNGNATQGSLSPFGSNWSNQFASSSYITTAANSANNLSADFTIEFWAYPTASVNSGAIMGTTSSSLRFDSGGYLYLLNSGSQYVLPSGAGFLPTNVWTHVAVTRSGSTIRFFRNGILVPIAESPGGALTATYSFSGTDVGRSPHGFGGSYTGLLSSVRIVNGTALYTAAFTPPAQPLTAVSGTSLLTCQSNRLIDNSGNNLAITRTGDVSVQRFSPFAPTVAYAPATSGGSGYFDGVGDYVTLSANNAFVFGTGDFTIEAWVYRTQSYGTFSAVITNWTTGWWFGFNSNALTFLSNGGTTVVANGVATPVNTWVHCAVSRSGTTTRLFVDGAVVSTTTDTRDYSGSNPIYIGQTDTANHPFSGYLSNLRVLKGTAAYTANFTPPTAPVAAVTNTSLLLNFTNAGIPDAAAKNVIETVGNAQVSTSVKKYGTGAIAFDGSGDGLNVNGLHTTGVFNQLTAANKINTIEFWLYLNAFVSPRSFLIGSWSGSTGWTFDVNTSGQIFISDNGAGPTVSISTVLTTGEWQHLAFVNNGTNIVIYRNGIAVGSPAVQGPTSIITPLTIGLRSDGSLPLNGYIDDLRITLGVARYTANFTPPTTAFPDQ